MRSASCVVRELGEADIDFAVTLLARFFVEEGFAGTPETITTNTRSLWADPYHWVGLAWLDGVAVGVVTVTTMLYVEWGRLGEIGDLYVLPDARGHGIGAALIDAAKARCRDLRCSAVSVVVTPKAEARHGLTGFYERLLRRVRSEHTDPHPHLICGIAMSAVVPWSVRVVPQWTILRIQIVGMP